MPARVCFIGYRDVRSGQTKIAITSIDRERIEETGGGGVRQRDTASQTTTTGNEMPYGMFSTDRGGLFLLSSIKLLLEQRRWTVSTLAQ